MDIVAIDARQGKRGKRETVKFAGTEAKEQIDSYINEVHMAKEDMSESASAAASSAKLAESWATGGTFARDDENVNNAKYWAEYAHTAEEHVVEAENAVMSAETKALAAAEAAALSETHAATSESHAETSEQKAELSESWAVGGTGKREGEDTNNAKYWAEYAKASAIGVSSFNGRQGVVTPQSGDYSYDQISNTPSAATSDTDGLMTAADKTKLDGIAEGATKVSIDSDVAEGSANAVSGGGVFTAIKAVKDSIVKTTLIDNLTTTTAGQGALDAHAGYSLSNILNKTGISQYKVIGSSYTFSDMINDNSGHTRPIFFTNWSDSTNFPANYGAGVKFAGLDSRSTFILYMVGGALYFYTGDWHKVSAS